MSEHVVAAARWPPMAVLLCTHNAEGFLVQQLESLLAQTRLPSLMLVHD